MTKRVTYKDVYLLVVKPKSTWETQCEKGAYTVMPLSEDLGGTSLHLEEDLIDGMERFTVYSIPRGTKEFILTNDTESHKSYLIFRK